MTRLVASRLLPALLSLLVGCGNSAEQEFKGYFARLDRGDYSARVDALEHLQRAEGRAALWAGLTLDPGIAAEPHGAKPAVAADLYRIAMGAGVDGAAFNLALLVIAGRAALKSPSPSEPGETLPGLLQRAANHGCVPAMFLLGQFHLDGAPGFVRNDVVAADWFEKAALFNREPKAELQLGRLYLDGRGRARDIAKGVALLTSAAEGGEADGAAELAHRATSAALKARWYAVAAEISDRYRSSASAALRSLSANELVDVQDAVEVWRRAFTGAHRVYLDPTIPWRPA